MSHVHKPVDMLVEFFVVFAMNCHTGHYAYHTFTPAQDLVHQLENIL